MNRKEFLEILEKELKGYPKDEIIDILTDYQEHFSVGKKKKRTEAQIAKSLGNPKTIAKQYKAEYHITKASQSKKPKDLLRAIFAATAVSVFNILFILGPFIGILGILIGLYAGVLGIFVGGIAGVVGSFALGALQVGIFASLGGFFVSLAVIAFAGLVGVLVWYITKWLYKATVWYLKLMIKIVKGEVA